MAQKTVGYVELEWICPNCGGRNPGKQKTCSGCGAAQPADVKFIQAAEDRLIANPQEETSDQSPSGPDIHCPFCGVRNAGNAVTCTNCGGDLKGGQKREAGQVVGAFRTTPAAPISCPACGEQNPPSNLRCVRCGAALPGAGPAAQPAPAAKKPFPVGMAVGLAAAGVIVLVLIILLFSALFSRRDVTALVSTRSWERSIEIEQYGPIPQKDWKTNIPSNAANIRCEDKYRETRNQPAPRSTEVCGTPYTVDQGDGTGKVVQDCEYLVYDAYCSYTLDGWAPIRLETLQGSEEPPTWPEPKLGANQRAGDRIERYLIVFNLDGKEERYSTDDLNLFNQAAPGSRWSVKVNGLGDIVEVAPPE